MRFQISACVILLIITLISAAPDLPTRLDPKGKLQIRLDFPLAKSAPSENARNILYSTYLEFQDDVKNIEEGQLLQIVADAFNEMRPESDQYGFNAKRKIPSVMTILAVDRYVFLASSQKGISYVIDVAESPVWQSLQRCQIAFAAGKGISPDDPDAICPDQYINGEVNICRHASGYGCGEVMSTQLWYWRHPDKPLNGLNGRVVTVGFDKPAEKGGLLGNKPPCGTGLEDKWGCNKFNADQGLTLMTWSTESLKPYDLKTLAGGVLEIGQVPMCA